MALQFSTTLGKGIVAPACYAKIVTTDFIRISELDSELAGPRVMVAFYFNKVARDADSKNYIEVREYLFPNWSAETRAQQYTYLQSLPDFAGSIDI